MNLSSNFHRGCFPFPEAADGVLQGPRGLWPGFGNGVSRRVILPLPGSCGGKALGPSPSWHWLHLPGDAGLLWGFSRLWPERAFSRCKPSQPKTQLCPAQGSPGRGGHQLSSSSSCASGLLAAEGPPGSESVLCWSQMLKETSLEAKQGRAIQDPHRVG